MWTSLLLAARRRSVSMQRKSVLQAQNNRSGFQSISDILSVPGWRMSDIVGCRGLVQATPRVKSCDRRQRACAGQGRGVRGFGRRTGFGDRVLPAVSEASRLPCQEIGGNWPKDAWLVGEDGCRSTLFDTSCQYQFDKTCRAPVERGKIDRSGEHRFRRRWRRLTAGVARPEYASYSSGNPQHQGPLFPGKRQILDWLRPPDGVI